LVIEADKENAQPNKGKPPISPFYVFEDLGVEYCEDSPQDGVKKSPSSRSHKAYVVMGDTLAAQVAPLKRVSFPQCASWNEQQRVKFLQDEVNRVRMPKSLS